MRLCTEHERREWVTNQLFVFIMSTPRPNERGGSTLYFIKHVVIFEQTLLLHIVFVLIQNACHYKLRELLLQPRANSLYC